LITLEKVRQRAESDAKTYGYYLNPDPEFLKDLLEGLKRNEERYGYPSCPCRLASGKFEFDRDITCPCDYRDPDVEEYGACYCALYVRKELFEGKTAILPVSERRPPEKQARAYGIAVETPAKESSETAVVVAKESSEVKLKLWYCKQCGYVVFREDPPYVCPICKAKREMFTEIKISIGLNG
jgi:ferredoxin-thioredoxin reductase catalytic subunit